jgi:hypothetical protein
MVAEITDQEKRRILREMAAEWLRLADAIRPIIGSRNTKWDDAGRVDDMPRYPQRVSNSGQMSRRRGHLYYKLNLLRRFIKAFKLFPPHRGRAL